MKCVAQIPHPAAAASEISHNARALAGGRLGAMKQADRDRARQKADHGGQQDQPPVVRVGQAGQELKHERPRCDGSRVLRGKATFSVMAAVR